MSWTTINTDEVEGPTDGLTMTTSTKVKAGSGGYLVRVDKTFDIALEDKTLLGLPATAMCFCAGTTPTSISWGSPSEVEERSVTGQKIFSRTYTGTPLDHLASPLSGTIYRLERHMEGSPGIPAVASVALAFDPP
ncbi:MAG: hypothetical protein IV090_24535 [Candidatus Sericytochromatia bacterium]|nr:hypothetical protein [Candidatus Sericytochromatia bacterium]